MNTTAKNIREEQYMTHPVITTGSCFATSISLSASMTADHCATEYSHFCELPSEIIEVIGSFLYDPKVIAAFCLTSRRVRAILMDKLRLYDPKNKLSSSEVKASTRKWKIPKFEFTKDITIQQLEEKEREGFYFDPNELFQWYLYHGAEERYSVYKSRMLFLRLSKAKDFNPACNDNHAIGQASKYGGLEVVKCLLKDKRVKPTFVAINEAYRHGHLEILKLLLSDSRVDPSGDGYQAFKIASRLGYLEIVKRLLADGRTNPAYDNNYSIKVASENGHGEVVKVLLADERVDPSAEDNYAIRWSTFYGHVEVVKLLLADGRVDPSAKDNEAIRRAYEYGHAEEVKLSIADKLVDLSFEDSYEIIRASENDRLEIFKLLLKHQKLRLEQEDLIKIRNRCSMNDEIMKLLLEYESRYETEKNES